MQFTSQDSHGLDTYAMNTVMLGLACVLSECEPCADILATRIATSPTAIGLIYGSLHDASKFLDHDRWNVPDGDTAREMVEGAAFSFRHAMALRGMQGFVTALNELTSTGHVSTFLGHLYSRLED